jgi:flagellar hook-basal body complex protein FliE
VSSMGIEAIGATLPGISTLPSAPTLAADPTQGVSGPTGPTGPQGSSGDFGHLLVKSLDSVEAMGDKASDLSVQAATGDLNAIHDYTIAATEAQVATQLTVTVRNKAVDAFNEIMRMSV